MKKINKKQAIIGATLLAIVIISAAAIYAYTSMQLNDNPWEHALLSGKTNGTVSVNNKSFFVNGDIRSNGSIRINSETVKVNGYAAAVSSVAGIAPKEKILKIPKHRHFLMYMKMYITLPTNTN